MRTADHARGRIGRLNALMMVPAAVCSVGLILVLTQGSGLLSLVVLGVWCGGGLALATRAGEVCAARVMGLRRLRSSVGTARLIRAAVRAAGFNDSQFDWYVAPSRDVNAFAFGRRGIAVTSGLLAAVEGGLCSARVFIAILVHEMGHHATAATRYSLPMRWWSGPCLTGVRVVGAISASVFGGRAGSRVPTAVLLVGLIVADVQAVQAGRWGDVCVLTALVLSAIVIPLLTAAVHRRAEWAADRFAARAGVGVDLAQALRFLDAGGHDANILASLFADHPPTHARVAALTRYTRMSPRCVPPKWRNPGDVAVASDRSGVFAVHGT